MAWYVVKMRTSSYYDGKGKPIVHDPEIQEILATWVHELNGRAAWVDGVLHFEFPTRDAASKFVSRYKRLRDAHKDVGYSEV